MNRCFFEVSASQKYVQKNLQIQCFKKMTTQLERGRVCFVQECCENALIMKIKPKTSQAVQPNLAAHVWLKLEPTLENIDNCA